MYFYSSTVIGADSVSDYQELKEEIQQLRQQIQKIEANTGEELKRLTLVEVEIDVRIMLVRSANWLCLLATGKPVRTVHRVSKYSLVGYYR